LLLLFSALFQGFVSQGGTVSPVLDVGIGMGYVDKPFNKKGTPLYIEVRGKRVDMKVTPLPFVPTTYYIGPV
jgi:aminomethyltransferase